MLNTASAAVSGMILFDKPNGWTSHDAVLMFRRMLPDGTTVGHCGTLDPIATGLLIILIGKSTKLQARMQGFDKVYSGLIRFGVTTDTGDVAGKISQTHEVPEMTAESLGDLLKNHCGSFEMAVPAYSAVKHRGKPLYQYARRGLPVPVKSRRSTVIDWKVLSYTAPFLEHRLLCSSGTYVRSLAESIGTKLGCGAIVQTLRREKIADFSVDEALTLEQVKVMSLSSLRGMAEKSLPILEKLKSAPALK